MDSLLKYSLFKICGKHYAKYVPRFLISSFLRAINVACNLLGVVVFNSQRFGTLCLFHLHRRVNIHSPMKIESSAIKHHTPGNNPKDYTQHVLRYLFFETVHITFQWSKTFFSIIVTSIKRLVIIIIIIIFIYCNWVVTRWQWLFNTNTKHEISLLLNLLREATTNTKYAY
jgi:hypothetical protein